MQDREKGSDARQRRKNLLVSELRRAAGPVGGPDLAFRLDLSTRSIRDYVRSVNKDAGARLIVSGRDGYHLDLSEYHRYRSRASRERLIPSNGPAHRLYYIVRHLVASSAGADVFAMGDDLSVSPATIEADLGKARHLLRKYDLTIEREREIISLQGPESNKRKLLRYLLMKTGEMDAASTAGYASTSQSRELHRVAQEKLAAVGIELNEYALNDLVLHLAIAADRTKSGHNLGAGPPATSDRNDRVWNAVLGLTDAVASVLNVTLLPQDQSTLYRLLVVRTAPHRGGGDDPRTQQAIAITREAVQAVSGQFLIDIHDEVVVASLAVHVQSLIARARAGDVLESPLGEGFRKAHPLIHELALLLAQIIESRAGISVGAGEIDFLALHLGNQVQRQMSQERPVTITCVAPKYRTLHEQLALRVSNAVQNKAVVEELITTLNYDWESISSDLVVSSVPLDLDGVSVVQVSPFLTDGDIDRVIAAVKEEAVRARRTLLKRNLMSLFEPATFHKVDVELTKMDVLELLSDSLYQQGYVLSDFIVDVLDRERRSPTTFGGPVAIPHSMYMDAARSGIAVLVSDTPIQWDSGSVRLVMMFAVSPEERHVFRDVFDQLVGLLDDPRRILDLVKASTSHETFVELLSELVDG